MRDEIGLTNVTVMIPFRRTVGEADAVLEILAEHGLKRKRGGLDFFVMAEIPANVELASEFSRLIETAHRLDRKVGICGQAPSDHPEFARFLVEQGIDTISVNPDSVVEVRQTVSEAESRG